MLTDIVFALAVTLHCILLTLVRAWAQDLLSEKANLPHGSNAVNGGFCQEAAILVKHLAQESLKKFRNSGVCLSKGKKRTRSNLPKAKTSLEVRAKGR